MFDKQQRKIKRSGKLITVLSKYGFKDLVSRMKTRSGTEHEVSEGISKEKMYERIRMALEELGPTFVKLGQTFSNREDLLPAELIAELQKLQDNVEEIVLDVPHILESEFNISVSEHFLNIDEKPIAAASIAQVYKAKLLDGIEVILKIRKPNVQNIIEDDLLLVKDLIHLISTYSELGSKLNLKQALATFEKSLLEEVSFVNEKNNILQFARNFKNHPDTYVPKIYEEYCNNGILCMEYISGIKITDVSTLRAHHLDPLKISEQGLQLFVSQILDFGFFHADPHAGNIIIRHDGKLVFIDFGAVGKIQPHDKELLETMIVAFVAKNPQKIVKSLKKMAVTYEIPDEKRFENDVAEVLEFVHRNSLKDIDPNVIITKMKDVVKDNHLYMPDYFYLLFKGIGLIEGVGRTINPELDVVSNLSAYSKKMFRKKLNPKKMMRKSMQKVVSLADNLDNVPFEMRSVLQKLDENELTVFTELKNLDKATKALRVMMTDLIVAILFTAFLIFTALIFISANNLSSNSFYILAGFGFIISGILAVILVLRITRK